MAPASKLPSRARPLFDPRREQAGYLGDAGRAQIRPAGGRIDPAQVRRAVELRQRAFEGSTGIVMTALSRGPAAMTARNRCEPMQLIVA